MGFAALYPSYVRRGVCRMGRAKRNPSPRKPLTPAHPPRFLPLHPHPNPPPTIPLPHSFSTSNTANPLPSPRLHVSPHFIFFNLLCPYRNLTRLNSCHLCSSLLLSSSFIILLLS